jgi:hypothetical protein
MRLPLALLLTALVATPALANGEKHSLASFLEAELRPLSATPLLVQAIAAQNQVTAGYTQEDIERLDRAWQSEIGMAESPLIRGVLDNPASRVLVERVEASEGLITEIFIFDARGLNVAASALTSDYWQGDEEKYSETVPRGPGAVHTSEVEFDESAQTYQVQISLPLVDPATGAVIGAMTVGLDAERLL